MTSKGECTVAEMGKELFRFTKKYLPDNHFNVYSTAGVPIGMTLSKEEHTAFKEELNNYLQEGNVDKYKRGIIEHQYFELIGIINKIFQAMNAFICPFNWFGKSSDSSASTNKTTLHPFANFFMCGFISRALKIIMQIGIRITGKRQNSFL